MASHMAQESLKTKSLPTKAPSMPDLLVDRQQ
jgi:hypothetical protein